MTWVMDFFTNTLIADQPVWVWLFFIGVVTVILFLDLGLFERKNNELSVMKSLFLFSTYIAIACMFGGWIWVYFGNDVASEFYTSYLVELGLSIDNVFMISLIFAYLNIPKNFQHRVLFWGILGAVVLRGLMIFIGADLIQRYKSILLVFAVFLIYSGLKMLFRQESEINLSDNKLIARFRNFLHVTPQLEGEKFFVIKADPNNPSKKIRCITPLFFALVLIEIGDALFATDSLPAVFAVSYDAFVVFSSNIFAVLGLRALYFLLVAAIYRFCYMQQAMAVLLITAGVKVFVAEFICPIPDAISLAITFSLILGGILASMIKTAKESSQPS